MLNMEVSEYRSLSLDETLVGTYALNLISSETKITNRDLFTL